MGVITNTGGTNIIDPVGLVSTNNFLNGNITQSSTQTTSSTSFVDVPGTTITFSLSRNTNVLILFSAIGLNGSILNNVCNTITALNIDGSDQSNLLFTPGTTVDGNFTVVSTSAGASTIASLSSGSHTLKLRFRAQSTGTAAIAFATISYIVLGS
jgi:hypothetical protein